MALYRFFDNEKVTPEALLEPHYEATARLAASFEQVLAIHDTTEVAFTGEREGLGRLSDGRRGFLAHTTLYAAGEQTLPLGVASLELPDGGSGFMKRNGRARKRARLPGTDREINSFGVPRPRPRGLIPFYSPSPG